MNFNLNKDHYGDSSIVLNQLEKGQLYFFRDWPNRQVPKVTAGVYTIWQNDLLVYVGMAGRKITSEMVNNHYNNHKRPKGLYSRLKSHASGRRGGDQFCVYICDRLVLKELTADQIRQISLGMLSLDSLVKQYIHTYLGYRFVQIEEVSVTQIEKAVRVGKLTAGKPLLNPA